MHPGSLATVALVPLIAWRVYVRFKRARGRQRLSRYRGPITLALYGTLIALVALANLRHPVYLLAFGLALVAGGALAAFALKRTTFEPTPKGLFYTPHGPVGVSLAILFVARLAYRLYEVYVAAPSAPRSAAEFAQSPLTSGTFGLLAGYYFCYMVGLVRWRWRVLKAKRERESKG